jgi:MFS family permease
MVSVAMSEATRRRIDPLKVVFALGYVMQGLANPFQGITYQPFYNHLHDHYGLDEAATQRLFARSYLAWSFKPIIGFLIDAYGRTRTLLIGLLGLAAIGYLASPLLDSGPFVFFGLMFGLSVVMAGTDVAIDRATVIAGAEEAKATGRSRATMVGLNQAICWLSIYGTAIVAAVAGGYVAAHAPFKGLLVALAGVPVVVLLFVLRLPKDTAASVPLRRSIGQFWSGLNSGSVLGIMLFFFLLHFQPLLGPIFIKYMLATLHFSQEQVGFSQGAGHAGYFGGVLLFMWKGVRWQERFGLRKVFRIYIVVGAVVFLTQLVLLEPWFGAITGALSRGLPFVSAGSLRLGLLCLDIALVSAVMQLIAMSTFSLVGAVVPVAAAGSLFAGFMSVTNLGYTFSYASGAWLYANGMSVAPLRAVQDAVFGIAGGTADKLSLQMLVLIGSLAYFTSFLAVHLLPEREATLAAEGTPPVAGPERWLALPAGLRRATNGGALLLGVALLALLTLRLKFDPVASVLTTFLGVCLIRKSFLDALLRRRGATT